jgi:hypothetical protein
MYYHAPEKTLPSKRTHDDRVDASASVLKLWTPRRQHASGDPYTPEQRGHLSRITLNHRNSDWHQFQYDVHQTKKGITATITNAAGQRRMTLSEIEWLTALARQELRDYDQPTSTLARLFETVTRYRARTQRRMTNDLNNMVDAYYAQEAGRSITIQ